MADSHLSARYKNPNMRLETLLSMFLLALPTSLCGQHFSLRSNERQSVLLTNLNESKYYEIYTTQEVR